MASRALGYPTIFTDHSLLGFGTIGQAVINKLIKFVLADVQRVICVSHVSRENTVLRACVPTNRVVVIPNAIQGRAWRPIVSLRPPWPPAIVDRGNIYIGEDAGGIPISSVMDKTGSEESAAAAAAADARREGEVVVARPRRREGGRGKGKGKEKKKEKEESFSRGTPPRTRNQWRPPVGVPPPWRVFDTDTDTEEDADHVVGHVTDNNNVRVRGSTDLGSGVVVVVCMNRLVHRKGAALLALVIPAACRRFPQVER